MATSNMGYQSFFQTTLSSNISDTDLTIPLASLPTPSEGYLVIESTVAAKREIIYYTSKTASAVVCPAGGRGYDGTTAVSHTQNASVIMAPVGKMFSDLRELFETTPQGWTSLSQTVSSVTNNGNRSYDVTFDSSVASILSPGMRLRTTRTVAAPTQCTSLNGTNQYWSKTSPAGMTFTDDFVVSAWVKLSSYGSAANTIASRYNGTSGWSLKIGTDGRIEIGGFNGGSGNYSIGTSYQSVPLNKWVHIAAQLDMSAFTATTTTTYIMIDGVDVPVAVSRAGTNPTALIQAGDLQVGAWNGSQFFNGKIAQVAIYSAKVTQANIKSYMSQGLAGTESTLISAYSFNGNGTDLNTTNANDLTAQNSAVATNADSPFGGQGNGTISSTLDYGIVTNVSTAVATVQVAENCTIPTSGGVSATSYSTQRIPYNFPGSTDRWTITTVYGSKHTQSSPTVNVWYNVGSAKLTIPVGSWKIGYQTAVEVSNNTNAAIHYTTLSTSSSTSSDGFLTSRFYLTYNNATANINHFRETSTTLTTATPYYHLILTDTSSAGSISIQGNKNEWTSIIYATCAYL